MTWLGSRMAELETQTTAPTINPDEEPTVPPPTDPVLFEAEMNPHLDALYRNALRLTGNANDAEDLLQDTYLRAYRFFYQYQPGTNAKAWLFRIMNTVFLNDYRRKSRQGETVSYDGLEDFYLYNRLTEDGLGGDHPETENPEKAVLEKLDIEMIQRAIQALPIEFRETVALATVEEMSYQEIADTLEIPVGTVRSRLSRGRKLLQRALWEYLNGDAAADRAGAELGSVA
jgi:RNA polymerase sigma-70 factor (ECF subfamily)